LTRAIALLLLLRCPSPRHALSHPLPTATTMYPNHQHLAMPPPQQRSVAPETFLLDQDTQQSLPADSVVALQQVDNRT